MEEMLQNFTSLGMTDVAFLVVNSKKERSQKLLPLLEARVSFPVYQDTQHEEVWNTLRGGKDDMFVYDRCGRLVSYIPFPLSLLDNDRSLVSNFILYAYHIDPCDGVTPCSETEIADIENKHYITHFLNDTQEDKYEQQNLTSRISEIYQEDINELWLAINETMQLRSNSTLHVSDHSSENITHSETQNHTVLQDIHSSIWETQNLHHNNTANTNFGTNDIPDPSAEQNLMNEIACSNSSNCNPARSFDANDINDLKLHNIKPTDTTRIKPKRICVAEDEKVCEQYSKRQLKRIQRCCAHIDSELNDEGNVIHENVCKSFQKKRCKKLRTVIKCCLKIYAPDENYESTDEAQTSGRQDALEIDSHHHHNKHAENAMERVP